jgi:deoxyribodipyrimidine photo-lyase
MSTGVVWFRRDLRLADNPAWAAATKNHEQVTALFVIDPKLWDRCHPRRITALIGHLQALDAGLQERGGRLRIELGEPIETVERVVKEIGAERIYLNRDVSPFARRRDESLRQPTEAYWGGYVHEVGSILTGDGKPYLVFTPFYRAWGQTSIVDWPASGAALVSGEVGSGLASAGLPSAPTAEVAGEEGAQQRLQEALNRVERYQDERDRPDLDSASGLSVDLKWGTLSPRQVVAEVGTATASRGALVRQLAWREFYAQLLWAYPHTVDGALRPSYNNIDWNNDPGEFQAWKEGLTGYPIVDAGMRQLISTGLMHNRVRLITASFLVKDLLIDWRWGEKWFRRLLADGDTPQNVGNWQWVAGTGADAAPYFRIFNPVSQGRRFDPEGEYVRRWVPELGALPAPVIHAPWEASPLELAAVGIELGTTYPQPIVDHGWARDRCLQAYQRPRPD